MIKMRKNYFVFFSVGNLVINWLFRENTEAFESVEINTDKKLLKFKNFFKKGIDLAVGNRFMMIPYSVGRGHVFQLKY